MMLKTQHTGTPSRRERQILDILYRRGAATASQVRADMAEAPGYSAVRAMLRILEDKGQVRHKEQGPRYVYSPMVPRGHARRSAIRHVLETFFHGSAEETMAALLDVEAGRLGAAELDRMAALIEQARKEGK